MPSDAAIDTLETLPGHLIRRLQQIAVGIFLDEVADQAVTPVQFALLHTAQAMPGMDQRSIAAAIGFDTSTIGAVVDRLEKRGLIARQMSAEDKRVRRLHVTAAGEALLAGAVPAMLRAQRRMLVPLNAAEQASFLEMLTRVVTANAEWSRAAKD